MRTRRSTSSSDLVSPRHQSVLLHEAVDALCILPEHTVLDATVGGAGHTKALAALLSGEGTIVGLDADSAAIDRAREALVGVRPRVRLAVANFRTAGSTLPKLGVRTLDRALFDLGWSAFQLDAGRGFSFSADEPLLMTYSAHPEGDAMTAWQIVNEWDESSIADVLYGWGEERFARRIARAIVAQRSIGEIMTARQLADVIAHATPRWYGRGKNPATKTFQALRIAVNDEYQALREGLEGVRALMEKGGRIAVITFHSGEDRIVKHLFAEWAKEGYGTLLTKRPLLPSEHEVAHNPRARSAKLRTFVFAM